MYYGITFRKRKETWSIRFYIDHTSGIMFFNETKRMIVSIICVCMVFMIPVTAYCESDFSENTIEPSRTINLVYDDSSSMIQSDTTNKYVDTWCQAKYAVEAFAAMLGEKDLLNIYVMSDYNKPKLKLKGNNSAASNVKKVHQMKTYADMTPFGSVRRAMGDLEKTKSDEKWLIILTDGNFQGVSNPDKYFSTKPDDIKVMYLGMGPEAGKIKSVPQKNIYYEKAKTSKDILDKLTKIGQQVFNRAKLDVKMNSIEFDIPMKELIVFAQGKGVHVSSIKGGKAKVVKSSEDAVVMYTESKDATTNKDYAPKNIVCDKTLQGNVATFRGSFPEESYSIDLKDPQNLKTIDVYYKPDVNVSAHMKDANGKEVKGSELKAGDYQITFSLTKGTSGEVIKSSPLLEPVEYEAELISAGGKPQIIHEGDIVTIGEGDLKINAHATYLNRYTVSTTLEKSIYKNKKLALSVKKDPGHMVKGKSFTSEDPLILKVELDGRDFTKEQWDKLDASKMHIDYAEKPAVPMEGFRIKKGNVPGELEIYPVLGKKTKGESYGDLKLKITYEGRVGNKETWKGSDEFIMKISDERSWVAQHVKLLIKLALLLLLLLILLGYMPPFKKRLPKRLKNKPTITSVPTMIGFTGGTDYGKYTKDMLKPFIPYVAETGIIRFLPKNVKGYQALRVKAAGGRKMNVTNIRSYAGKDAIRFNGNPIPEGIKKPMKFSAGLTIEVATAGKKYSCTLNN